MKRPAIQLKSPEQVTELYSWYQEQLPSEAFARFAFRAFAAVMKPRLSENPGTFARLGYLKDRDVPLVLSINHINNKDQYLLAGATRRYQPLQHLAGSTRVLAKPDVFAVRQTPILPLSWQRAAVDKIGAVPTFRAKDSKSTDSQEQALRTMSTKKAIDLSILTLKSGMNLAIFPEGTRNQAHPETVQPLQAGIGRIVGEVAANQDVAVVPVGLWYPRKDHDQSGQPQVHIGWPITDHNKLDNVLEYLPYEMQIAVDNAQYHQQLNRAT